MASTIGAYLREGVKQGPTPKLALKNAMIAAQNGVPYVPQVGVDGAGATYLANEPAIIRALADGPASFSDRWSAINDRAGLAAISGLSGIPQIGSRIPRLVLMRRRQSISIRARQPTFRSIYGICKTRIACLEPAPNTCGF